MPPSPEPDFPGLQYQLDVFAISIADVVVHAGGWLFDRAMAGWEVTVLVPSCHDLDVRPLQILGAGAMDLEAALAGPRRRPAACGVAAPMYKADPRVREALDSGTSTVAMWGPNPPSEVTRRLTVEHHEVSAAARAFKARSLAACGLGDQPVEHVECFHTGSPRRQRSAVLTVAR